MRMERNVVIREKRKWEWEKGKMGMWRRKTGMWDEKEIEKWGNGRLGRGGGVVNARSRRHVTIIAAAVAR